MRKLLVSLLVLFVLITALPVHAQEGVWTENWEDGWQEDWYYFADLDSSSCSRTQSGVFIQDCWSTAIVSHDRFPVSQRIEFTGTIFSRPGLGTDSPSNLAHHALFGADDGPGGEYCGLYLRYNKNTRQDEIYSISYLHPNPRTVLLGTTEHKTHEVSIIWEPLGTRVGSDRQQGTCSYLVDRVVLLRVPYSFVLEDVALWQGATSVGWGQGNDGSTSYAEHGPITVKLGR